MIREALSIIVLLTSAIIHSQPFDYKGITITFPATVKEVSDKYHLNFDGPGFYYKMLPDSVVTYLEFACQTAEFRNERQPASVFYDRPVTIYLFKFKNKLGLFEAEQKTLEAWLGSKMRLTIETGGALAAFPDEKRNKMPAAGTFKLAEGTTKDDVRVFLREVPRGSYRQTPMLQVMFCKGVTDKRIYDRTHAME